MIQTRQYENAVKAAGFPNINNACKFAKFYHLFASRNNAPPFSLKKPLTDFEVLQVLNAIDCHNQLLAMKLPGGWEYLAHYEQIKTWWLTNCSHL